MSPSITVVALGPGKPELMTLQSVETLRQAQVLVLRTARHPAAQWLQAQGISFSSLDDLYDQYEDFDQLHRAMAAELWKKASEEPVTFAVPFPSQDGAVDALASLRPENAALKVLPGLSQADTVFNQALGVSTVQQGQRIITASAISALRLDPTCPLLVTEIDSPLLASDVKLMLTDLYPDELECSVLSTDSSGIGCIRQITLCELDRLKHYDQTLCLLVPPVPFTARNRFDTDDLLQIMEVLRSPDGCPWDREQTHQSLRKYLIEECYEAAGAIDAGDDAQLADELGDVLLQIVFHASIGRSHASFNMRDIATCICRKMIFRHAHVFGTVHCANAEEVSVSWEKLKKAEKHQTTQAQAMKDVALSLPALMRAAKVQKKAAAVGFDWDSASEALYKVHEEADEVGEELLSGTKLKEEIGDLLFACVNVARLADVEPEEALEAATQKFLQRFEKMEHLILSDGKKLDNMTLSEMDAYWEQVKAMK